MTSHPTIRERCYCSDPGCPHCQGDCHATATETVYRVDMADATGTLMCGECGEDAMSSGVYREYE